MIKMKGVFYFEFQTDKDMIKPKEIDGKQLSIIN